MLRQRSFKEEKKVLKNNIDKSDAKVSIEEKVAVSNISVIIKTLLFIFCLGFTQYSIVKLSNVEEVDVEVVLASAWLTCASTGLGVLPFIVVEKMTPVSVALANAIACGMMCAASYQMIHEGHANTTKPESLLFGFSFGVIFIYFSEKFDFDLAKQVLSLNVDNNSTSSKRMLLIVAVMTLHSFAEGVGLGVSFHSSTLGSFITTTLAVHNIPEGLALSVALIPSGVSLSTTFLLCIMSSLPQPIMAVPAYLFVDTFKELLPFGLGFAGGAMLYVALFELFLEAKTELGVIVTTIFVIISSFAMLFLQDIVS